MLPGSLDVVDVHTRTESYQFDRELEAKVNDVIEVRIPNPAFPIRVHDLEVKTEADAILAGIVEHIRAKKVGSDRISIFVSLEKHCA